MIKLFGAKLLKFIFLTVWARIILAQSCSLNKPGGEPPGDTTIYRHFSFRQDILMFPYMLQVKNTPGMVQVLAI